jgi:hypothetical protein
MRRVILGLTAAVVATVLIFGPARSLLTGQRMQLTGDSHGTTAPAHGDVTSDPVGPVASAAAAPAANAARVSLDVRVSDKPAQGYVLKVRLTTPDGRPYNEATVRFYETVQLFGTREMLIATARTDGQGNGSTSYLPARTGGHEIIARVEGRGSVGPAESRQTFEATVAAPGYRAPAPPLAAFSRGVPYGVAVVLLAVWALIAFAFFGTALGIRRGADPQHTTVRRKIA